MRASQGVLAWVVDHAILRVEGVEGVEVARVEKLDLPASQLFVRMHDCSFHYRRSIPQATATLRPAPRSRRRWAGSAQTTGARGEALHHVGATGLFSEEHRAAFSRYAEWPTAHWAAGELAW